jgi:hypothetical protein
MRALDRLTQEDTERLVTTTIREKEQILDVIKTFLGRGR